MKLHLRKMTMKNVKGVKSFVLEPDGQSVIVTGDNGTGKTTIFDAYLWCLFDCDSSGRKGAEAIKTTGGSDYVHYLDHEVEIIFDLDEKSKTFKKVLSEKWTKPRGKQEQRFDGNVTSYWVDDVPTKANDYSKVVDSLVPDGLFQALTDPAYFSTQLHWRDRLQILTNITGKLSTAEIAGDDPALLALVADMGERSLEDYKKIQQDIKRKIDKEITEIPLRIDEVTKGRPESQNWATLTNSLYWAQEQVKTFDAQLAKSSEAVAEVRKLAAQLEQKKAQRTEILNNQLAEANSQRLEIRDKIIELSDKKKSIKRTSENISVDNTYLRSRQETMNAEKKNLYDRFDKAKEAYQLAVEEVFELPEIIDTCPLCDQAWPEEKRKTDLLSARRLFEDEKAQKIEACKAAIDKINHEGKMTAEELTSIEEQINANNIRIDELNAEVDALEEEAEELQKQQMKTGMVTAADLADHPDVLAANLAVVQLEATMNEIEDIDNSDLLRKKERAQEEVDHCTVTLATRKQIEEADKRIEELQKALKAKGVLQAETEGKLFAIDEFIIARTKAIEGKINAMFSQVSFKLFEEQVNGGIVETCEAVIDQTTFGKANTASQINAGLDIIAAISKHMDISVPVFVDRLESNLHLYPIESQYIALQAKEQYLNVEVLNDK